MLWERSEEVQYFKENKMNRWSLGSDAFRSTLGGSWVAAERRVGRVWWGNTPAGIPESILMMLASTQAWLPPPKFLGASVCPRITSGSRTISGPYLVFSSPGFLVCLSKTPISCFLEIRIPPAFTGNNKQACTLEQLCFSDKTPI